MLSPAEGRTDLGISTSEKPQALSSTEPGTVTRLEVECAHRGVSSRPNVFHKRTLSWGLNLAWRSQTAGCQQPWARALTPTRPKLRLPHLKCHRTYDTGQFSHGEMQIQKLSSLLYKVLSSMSNGRKCTRPCEFKPRNCHSVQVKLIKAQLRGGLAQKSNKGAPWGFCGEK